MRLSVCHRAGFAAMPLASSSRSAAPLLPLLRRSPILTTSLPHGWSASQLVSSRAFATAAKSGGGAAAPKSSPKKKVPKKNKKIKIVLTEDVAGLGVKGEDVEVAKGYARNYLFPKKLAVYCTEENYKLYESERANIDYAKRQKLQELTKAKKRLSKVLVTMKRQIVQTEPSQVLHAPVSTSNIVEKLWLQHKIKLNPEQLTLDAPLTQIGTFSVPVRLEDIDVALKVRVEAR